MTYQLTKLFRRLPKHNEPSSP